MGRHIQGHRSYPRYEVNGRLHTSFRRGVRLASCSSLRWRSSAVVRFLLQLITNEKSLGWSDTACTSNFNAAPLHADTALHPVNTLGCINLTCTPLKAEGL
ncbi:hypothetical protein M404DRAFT_848683 [Pisolithus tinctorius Marx 270]|uniref:Uncharacterized protein n=1 Tax=Pisolithus tinctorius Marx 270 TaxID=870435 RepID=A0A0C3NSS7_PISTI|nr:hypothetical protein M404DRAFT_848683 [Pisolithus tinctorius Marx 270]